MRPVHRLFLVLLLFFAQLAAGAHAVEHAAGSRDDGLPTHTCELCVAGHDLGAALPTVAALHLLAVAPTAPDLDVLVGRSFLPPPAARQGAPPHA